MLILMCIEIPIGVVGLVAFLRTLYGDEVFGLGSPPQDLNRTDDYRLIKTRFSADRDDRTG